MPGLLRGIARTAVVAGTFTSVSNRVSRRQYNRWSQQDQQQAEAQQYEQQQQQQAQQPAAAAPAPSGTEDKIAQLKQLGDLKSQGILTEEEFAAEKAKILA